MRYMTFNANPASSYAMCILTPYLQRDEIKKIFLDPYGIDPNQVLLIQAEAEPGKKKPSAKFMKEFINCELQQVLDDFSIQYLICTDVEYFKVLTKQPKAEVHLGYVMDSVFGSQKVVYTPSHRAIFYNPDLIKEKIQRSMRAVVDHAKNQYRAPGTGIIHFADYPQTNADIKAWLDKLLEMDRPLTVDIEAFSLKAHTAGIGTITFCWDEHNGIAFPVDYEPDFGATQAPFGKQVRNEIIRDYLLEFFLKFKQKLIYHNIAYDGCVLIYQLFMKDITDTKGLLNGLDVMLKNWDDTKLITYLATNTCAGNELKLKALAQEFAGNYAQDDIDDITKIPLVDLLEYNLVDGLSTWYVHKKQYPQMVADQQEGIYKELFQPATVDILQMQLTGMPINLKRVREVEQILKTELQSANNIIENSVIIQEFVDDMNDRWVDWKNSTLKKKRVTKADAKEVFNPNSDVQMQRLLYEMIGLPIIETTASGQPAVDGDTLKNLLNHTTDPKVTDLLSAFLLHRAVDKILSVYIPAFLNAVPGSDGWHYLCGNFNLGGTVSGRLSSSEPNLQNIPAGSKYGKLIKSCFMAPPGWIFVGLDFASLEDRISALTTKDPNKLSVYTDGFDGHCLRAYAYFSDQMPDIENTVESINSIKKKYEFLRNLSKAPTFLLTYGGTYLGMMKNCGFPEDKAKIIEEKYHQLYVVSDQWVAEKLKQAAVDGYVTCAFGLRVRTPLLKQSLMGIRKTPHEAKAEGRTAGNALGQSYGLLNSRASVAFMRKVRQHGSFREGIRPCAHIHDAQYYIIKDDVEAIHFMNEELVQEVSWQNDPAIWHEEVKIGGELDLFWPSWEKGITLPNHIPQNEISDFVNKTLIERAKK